MTQSPLITLPSIDITNELSTGYTTTCLRRLIQTDQQETWGGDASFNTVAEHYIAAINYID
ncbi:MAG: hypothetical protein OXE78_10210 [Gammaproteobacteria bacterium]|nr:hypothetical protein [Gammaproteobacteria bacterium]